MFHLLHEITPSRLGKVAVPPNSQKHSVKKNEEIDICSK